jgi:hypothetical protein
MFQINLVPEVQQQKQNQAKRNTYATFFSISLVIITISSIVILGVIKVAQDVRLKSVESKIEKVEEESLQYKDLEETVLSLEAGLNAFKSIMNGENSWTRLLPHIEAATPVDVTYTRIDIAAGGLITAELRGETIESLAKFNNSYKHYQVLIINGTGKVGEKVIIRSGQDGIETAVMPNGKWVQALRINPNSNQEIVINRGAEQHTITYLVESGKINIDKPGVQFEVKNLFTNLNTRRYEKEQSGSIKFDATFNVYEGALW